MIEPTDEMLKAFRDAFNQAATNAAARSDSFEGGEITKAGLAAVLAIVERDYEIRPRVELDPAWRCAKCGSPLARCADENCVDPAQCGDAWCAEHMPDGAW